HSTPCPDSDGNTCTTAGCDGNGVCDQNHVVLCCSLDVKKTACAAAPPPPGAGCTGGAIALTLKYTGQPLSGATTVTVTGSSGASATYNLPSLDPGDVLTSASENDFTIDATAHGQSKLGSKTTVTIDGVSEVLHTSCSCKATPETNLALCDPMCLDSSSPNTVTGTGNARACRANATAAALAPCVLGYPRTSQNPRTSLAFNESEVLRAFKTATVGRGERPMVFYNGEHALTLGVRRVLVK